MNLYWNTVAVVMGILTPAIIVLMIKGFADLASAYRSRLEARVELARKQPPYSKIVATQAPNPSMYCLKFYRGNELVHEDGAYKG